MRLLCIFVTALAFSFCASAKDNPFEKPDPPKKETLTDVKTEGEGEADKIELINALTGRNGVFNDDANQLQKGSQFISMGYLYRGTINGVDIYFDPKRKRYIKDRGEVLDVDQMTTQLPPIDKVNY